ncbi:hypothetical protein LP109_13150 [Moraxella bovis]|uniref:hypothetical protein n=1 Tax=Moraxella bovis TaxID=476 RepID=UPI00099196B3|nr:hypothetical protein [Moraxella bovis]OOR88741.1 hypothetical protein B0182_09600 [Moraxella bovis]UZA16040.1 hypothetical protein LP109_10330 [Moraxella bovis]UZA16538.1 hypothetical protein LP109_13150 [Moraxella bovis]
MFASLLGDIVSQLKVVLFAIVGMTAVVLSLLFTLLSYKKYREAMFVLYPKATEDFIQWQKENGDNFDSINDSAQAYINAKNAAAKFEMMHGKEYRKKQQYFEGRMAYEYFQRQIKAHDKIRSMPIHHAYYPAIEKMGYRGFDDDVYFG